MGNMTVSGKEYTPREIIAQAERAPGVLGAIAGFSLLNSVLLLFNVDMMFVIGLGATFVIDAFLYTARQESGGGAMFVMTVIGLAINAAIIGLFLLLWWLARRGSRAAYITAGVLYLIDGTIFLLLQDWMGVGFHVFFLFLLVGGYNFVKRRPEAEALLRDTPAPFETPGGAGEPTPPLLSPAPVEPDAVEDEVWVRLESLWASLPAYVREAEENADPDDGENLYADLARLGFSHAGGGDDWNDEHLQVVRQHLMHCERAGYGEPIRQFNSLALGALLGMHGCGRLDDAGYHHGGQVLAEYVARKVGESEV